MELSPFQKDKLESCILKYLKSLPKYLSSGSSFTTSNNKKAIEKPTPTSFLHQVAIDLNAKLEFKYELKVEHENYEFIDNCFSIHTFKAYFIVPVNNNGDEVRVMGTCTSRNKRISKEFASLDIIFQLNRLRSTQNHLIKILM